MLWGVELCVEFRTVDEKVGEVGVEGEAVVGELQGVE